MQQSESISSRRRSIVQIASRKIAFLDGPKLRKVRLPDDQSQSRLKISSPFNFRDLTERSSSSSSAAATADQIRASQHSEQPVDTHCINPSHKPLPSLPTATIISSSPIKVKRSLIDAEERPLRRSLSPQQPIFEDWPSLSPQKKHSTSKRKMPSAIIPSGESIVERMKKLNISKDEIVNNKQESSNKDTAVAKPVSQMPTSSVVTSQVSSTQAALGKKTPLPPVRQTKTSELRLSLNPRNPEEHKKKRSKIGSPLGVTSGNITTRSRPLKRTQDTPRGRMAASHSRSRSRHRATAEGSPYIVATQSCKSNNDVLNQGSPLVLDPKKVETEFCYPGSVSKDTRMFEDEVDQNELRPDRNGPLPLPEDVASNLANGNRRAEANSGHQPQNISDTMSEGAQSSDDGNDDGQKLLNTSSSPFLAEKDDRNRGKPEDEPDNYHNQPTANDGERRSSILDLIEDDEQFHVRPLSKKAPQYGPVLRVSPTANDLLRDVGQNVDDARDDVTNTERGNVDGYSKTAASSAVREPGRPPMGDNICQNVVTQEPSSHDNINVEPNTHIVQGPEQGQISEHHSIPRKPVPIKQVQDGQRQIWHATTTSAPPVKPGAPRDNTRTTAWPFKESAIAPFKTSSTPEQIADKCSEDLMNSNRNSSNSSHTQPSPGSHRKYNVGEALDKIRPFDRTAAQKAILAKTVSIHQSASPKSPSQAFPPRISSRKDGSSLVTGLRTARTQNSNSTVDLTPPPRNPLRIASKPISQPRNAKSFTRNTDIRTVSGNSADHGTQKVLSSPLDNSGSTSTGKGMLSNIRTLFHKRSNLHGNSHVSLRRSDRIGRAIKAPTILTSTTSTHPSKSPQVKNTSSPAAIQPRRTPAAQNFPVNPAVRPLTSSSPIVSTSKQSSPTKPNDDTNNTKPPRHEEPPQIKSATKLVYRLLDLVQQDSTALHRKEQLLELSKLLVSALTAARDAEKALEQARSAADVCEVKCVQVRSELGKVDELVRRIVDDE